MQHHVPRLCLIINGSWRGAYGCLQDEVEESRVLAALGLGHHLGRARVRLVVVLNNNNSPWLRNTSRPHSKLLVKSRLVVVLTNNHGSNGGGPLSDRGKARRARGVVLITSEA
jgi:hypothetical protein